MFDRIAAAHPGRATNGSTVNFVMRINPVQVSTGIGEHSVIVYRVDDSNSRTVIQTIKMKRLPYIHSFTVTENFVVLVACPLYWQIRKLMFARPVLDDLDWQPSDGSTIYVMKLDGKGKPLQFKTDAFFAMACL